MYYVSNTINKAACYVLHSVGFGFLIQDTNHDVDSPLTCASNDVGVVDDSRPDHSVTPGGFVYGCNDATHNTDEDNYPRDRTPRNHADTHSTGGAPRTPGTSANFKALQSLN